jgi:hypothetical protein
MPNYVLQYDLSTNHIEDNGHDSSNVYKYLARRLSRRGWTKHQYSCWRCDGKAVGEAAYDANFVANDLEAQYGVGVFVRLEYQRHLQFIQLHYEEEEEEARKESPD